MKNHIKISYHSSAVIKRTSYYAPCYTPGKVLHDIVQGMHITGYNSYTPVHTTSWCGIVYRWPYHIVICITAHSVLAVVMVHDRVFDLSANALMT